MNSQLPTIEKGVPIPDIKMRDGRHMRRQPSKWRAFMLKLEIGDSFVVEWPECSSVRAMAKSLGVEVVWLQLKERGPHNRPQERYWRVRRSKKP